MRGQPWVTIPVVLVAAVSGVALAYWAFRAHENEFPGTRGYGLEKYVCVLVAVVDVATDALFVGEVGQGLATFFHAFGFLLASVALNTVLALYAFCYFKKRSDYRGTYGIVTVLACTSSELLALLPWEGGDDDAGFPADDGARLFTVQRMHFALVTFEDAPAAVIQIFYVVMHGDDTSAATWLSLVATCVAAMWRLFVKADDVCRERTNATPAPSNEQTEIANLRAENEAHKAAAAMARGRNYELTKSQSQTRIAVKYADGEILQM